MFHKTNGALETLVVIIIFAMLLVPTGLALTIRPVFASSPGTIRQEYLVVKPDMGGVGYDQFYPELMVVNQGDQVNLTVRNTDNEGFQLKIENITTATIQPGSNTANGIEPVDTPVPIFNATQAGIFAYSSEGHPEMNGYLVVLPSDWSSYNPSQVQRTFTVLAIPDFAGDAYDKWLPGVLVVNQGDKVSINVRSMDTSPHGFAIAAYGIDAAVNPAQQLDNGTLVPTTTSMPNFIASTSGIYIFLCTVPCGAGHQEMVGTLVVLSRGGSQYSPVPVTSYNYLVVQPDYAGDGYDKFVPGVMFVNQGDLVYVRVRNTDTIPHGFTMPGYGINNETIEPATQSGNETTPTDSYVTPFLANQPGIYEFICSIPCGPGHGEMIGYLVVLPKLQGTTPTSTTQTTTTIAGGVSFETAALTSFGMIIVGFIAGLIVLSRFAFPKKTES